MAEGDVHTMWDGEKWINKVEGGQRASNSALQKTDAESAGRQMAIKHDLEHVIHRQDDNTIQRRNTYPRSRDPRRLKS